MFIRFIIYTCGIPTSEEGKGGMVGGEVVSGFGNIEQMFLFRLSNKYFLV